MISFWILNFTVLKISKWHNKINVAELKQRGLPLKSIFLLHLMVSCNTLQLHNPLKRGPCYRRLALISWCTQLNVLGQRFPGTSPRDQYPLSGIWEVSGWRAWDANYIMRLLHHKHNPGPCMYVFICKNLFTLQGTWCRVR